MKSFLGIDFGTTNSALAIAQGEEAPRLIPFPKPGGGTSDTWRSVLFFEPGIGAGPEIHAGALAIDRYIECGGEGRFIQSAKSHLASRLFNKTSILGRNYALDDLISIFLLQIREVAGVPLGDTAVVGRPVRYWGATSTDDDERAVKRMRSGLAKAGFHNIVFEQEPTAAALSYSTKAQAEQLILSADFGGGTSDFCLQRVYSGQRKTEILAVGGIGIGGDTFDGCIVDSLISPLLGKGSSYSDAFGASTEVPRTLFNALRRWHHLAFLKSKKNISLLHRVFYGAEFPDKIRNFIHVVENGLGLPLHQSVESAKVRLSVETESLFLFRDDPIEIQAKIERHEFELWIRKELDKIDDVLETMLREVGISPNEVNKVFTTGGSSFVPAVRSRLEKHFPGKLVGGNEMTSVALGLAESARQAFL